MQIKIKKGSKGDSDKLYFVTMNEEAFSITKFGVLINSLALNELEINKEKIERRNNFFFEESIKEVINMAKDGINFRDWLNEESNLKEWCKKYYLNIYKVKKETDNDIQITLEGFLNGST